MTARKPGPLYIIQYSLFHPVHIYFGIYSTVQCTGTVLQELKKFNFPQKISGSLDLRISNSADTRR